MMDTGQPLIIPDVASYPHWVNLTENPTWIHSYIGAPIRLDGRTIGFLHVNSAEAGIFGSEHAARLQIFADQAARLGCQLMLEKCSGLHSQKTAVRRLLDEGVDGLILPPPLCDDRPRVQSLLREGLPLLALGGGEPLPEVLSVRIDDFQGALTMTRYLIRLGHRRIGFIRGDEEHAPSQKRYEGFLQGMREAGLEIDEALIVRGRFTYQSGLAAAETLLQTPRRPTAIFASNDDMAAAVLAVAHGMRIYVPDELSVCGFDDTPVASTVWPQITTIHQPIAAMGRAAVTAMTEAIKAARAGRDHGPAHMTMKFSLIERGSAGPAPQLQIFRSQTEGGVLPR